jgi:hypothetical protein
MNVKEHTPLPLRTVYDPCPICGARPTGLDARPEYVKDNPEAVILGVVNPYPNPMFDEYFCIDTWITFQPCGHTMSGFELERSHWKIVQYT